MSILKSRRSTRFAPSTVISESSEETFDKEEDKQKEIHTKKVIISKLKYF